MQMHLRMILCATVVLGVLSSQIEKTAAAPQSSPGQAELRFFLSALMKHNSPAVLKETDLSVFIDNTAAQIKGVRSVKDDPLLFAVLVDVSKSDAATGKSIKEAAFQLFESLARAQNQGYLVLFSQGVGMSEAPLSVSQARTALDSAKFDGASAVYEAIEETCKQKLSRSANPGRPRRVILVISDGEDNMSKVGRIEAEQVALEEGVSVFSVVTQNPFGRPQSSAMTRDPLGRPMQPASELRPQGEKFLEEISERTGGFATDKDLKHAVTESLAAIEAQWAVALDPTQSADRKLHPMRLRCSQKDVHVSAPSEVLLE